MKDYDSTVLVDVGLGRVGHEGVDECLLDYGLLEEADGANCSGVAVTGETACYIVGSEFSLPHQSSRNVL